MFNERMPLEEADRKANHAYPDHTAPLMAF